MIKKKLLLDMRVVSEVFPCCENISMGGKKSFEGSTNNFD